MSTGINIFQINEEEVMELSFWGWGMRQLCRVHVFRQQIVGFYIFVSVQYVYIHCGYTPFRHRYLNNICVLFGVTEALLCCCIAVVVNLQNCRVPSSALIYLLYVQLYIYCISFMSEWAPRDKSKEPMKNWIQLTFSRYRVLSTVQLFFCVRLFIECSNNVHMFMHSWASLLLKVTSVKR